MSKKLLLADDSITIQKVIQITFANEDCQLTITDNGDTAYDRARELHPDLVLADVYMPGKNGYELCAAIKQTPSLQHVPVLLLAGSFEPFDEARARAVGAADWIEKPFESQTLIDKVAALLSAASTAAGTPAAMPVVAAEPVAESFDPFADVAFDTPTPAAPAWPDGPDDWRGLEPGVDLPPATTLPDEFVFEDFAGPGPEFSLTDTAVPFAEAPPAVAFVTPPAGDPAFAAFDDGDDVLPLGDDDILGVEDLEPLAQVPTLTPWSRDEVPSAEPFPDFAEFIADSPVLFDQPAPAVEAAAAPLPAAVAELATATGAAAPRALVLSGEELEQLVERAVARAIEKLAGTVLEQVAWEVVPDLAEALIKEEIRQIKGAAD
jgi:CheY-like chemotaxis protein